MFRDSNSLPKCLAYLSKIRASFRTFPKLMYASRKFGSRATAFSK